MSKESKPQVDTAEQPLSEDELEAAKTGRIYLVSYPKIVFLYPSFVMALVTAVIMSFLNAEKAGAPSNAQVGFTMAFLIVLGVNLVVLSFDFPRTTSLTLFFLFASIILGAVLLITFYPNLLPSFLEALKSLRPFANATFYWLFAAVLGVIYLMVLVVVQFDYWEVRSNELLHHHGFLSNLERLPAPNLRVEKEIVDIFEYLLLRSGRLILTPQDGRPIILDNVIFISGKEDALTRMLSTLRVEVRNH